jgi:GTP-binding protein
MEFWRLGFDPVVEISAEHGTGVGDLLDEVISRVRRTPQSESAVRLEDGHELPPSAGPDVAVAVIGRPNVGKSSLLNRLMREERALVSDMPGTTRDPVTGMLTWHRRQFRIVDTAGLRRPGRVRGGGQVELVSVAGTKKAITEAEVVALVVDALEGAADQDAAIGGEADRMGRGIVIVANKWDLVKDRGEDYSVRFDDELRRKMRFLDYAPILHISALTGERSGKVLETIDKIAKARLKRVPTPALNAFVERVTAANPPVSPERRHVRILYAAQIRVGPPTFVFFTNVATSFHFSYTRFLVNQLRDQFGFEGTPIRVQVRRRKKRGSGPRDATEKSTSGRAV